MTTRLASMFGNAEKEKRLYDIQKLIGPCDPWNLKHIKFAIQISNNPQDLTLILESMEIMEAAFVFVRLENFENLVRLPEMNAAKLRNFLLFFSHRRVLEEMSGRRQSSHVVSMTDTNTRLFLTMFLCDAAEAGRAEVVQVLFDDGRADALGGGLRPLRFVTDRATEAVLMRYYVQHRSANTTGKSERFNELLPLF